MTRLTTRLGDRLLAALAPKKDAAAAHCWSHPIGGGCYRRCCTGSGCGPAYC